MGAAELSFWVMGAAIAAALIAFDLRWFILPDWLCLALGLAGIGFHWANGWTLVSASGAAAGAAAGAGLLLVIRLVYLHWRGIEAVGLGDVKFMGAAGLWVGVWNVPLLLAVASIGTLLTLGGLRLSSPSARRVRRHQRIPFGPGLCMALILISAMQAFGK